MNFQIWERDDKGHHTMIARAKMLADAEIIAAALAKNVPPTRTIYVATTKTIHGVHYGTAEVNFT